MKKRFCLKTVALATVLILTGCVGSEDVDNSEIAVTTTSCILSETELVTETKPPQSVTSLNNDITVISVTEKNETVSDVLYEKVSSLKCFSSIKRFCDNVDVSQNGMNADEVVKLLADKNIVCYYTFNSDVMFHDYQKYDDNGYGEIRHYLFSSHSELEKFVYSTYEKNYAEILLSELYGSPETLFKGDDSVLLYNPSVQGINVLVGEVFSPYKCEITDITDIRIDFNIRFLENNKLMFSSVAVFEDGEWRLREMFPNIQNRG